MNRVFDHSSSQVDEFLRIPEGERRPDLYRPQETIPREHPNGYRGPGLNLRDSQLQEGLPLPKLRPDTRYVPGADKEGVMEPMRLDPPEPSDDDQGSSPQSRLAPAGPAPRQGSRPAGTDVWQRRANPVRSAENAR
jgi:hypothetical protein